MKKIIADSLRFFERTSLSENFRTNYLRYLRWSYR